MTEGPGLVAVKDWEGAAVALGKTSVGDGGGPDARPPAVAVWVGLTVGPGLCPAPTAA